VEQSLRGTLVDQPAVVGGAGPVLERAGVGARCAVAAGSFFDGGAVPEGADVYVLKNILHDWGDADAARILRRVRAAMTRPGARAVLVEVVRSARAGPEPWNVDFADFLDLNMLVTVGGRERTRAEWARLLAAAGLELVRVVAPGTAVRTAAPCAIEARVAPAAAAAAAALDEPAAAAEPAAPAATAATAAAAPASAPADAVRGAAAVGTDRGG
jgi:hypothetical protein